MQDQDNHEMSISVETEWTVGQLFKLKRKEFLRVNREYQRGQRWTTFQKQLFIDSIFRGYSIPAFYFHKIEESVPPFQSIHLDIVDGQQRIDAIYGYSDDAFPLLDPTEDNGFKFPNFVKSTPCPWGGKRFSELSIDLQQKLNQHRVVVYSISTNNENNIRDLFIRLQGGTPLTPQDKRDSWPGNFTEFVLRVGGKTGVDRWYGLPVFTETVKAGNESRRQQLAAQIFMLLWLVRREKKFCDIKSVNIDEFYHSQVDFDPSSRDAKQFERVGKKISECFEGKPSIAGHYLIHLFLLVDSLIDEYASGWEPHLANCLFEFERRRKQGAEDNKNQQQSEARRYYSQYGQHTQTRSDNATTIRQRHAFFVEEMLQIMKPKRLSERRTFSDLERQTIYFRDREICQWCKMNSMDHRVSWDSCEIHHVVPYTDGGETTVDNGALVHKECHPKAQADVASFQEWWYEFSLEDNSERRTKSHILPPNGTTIRFSYKQREYGGEIRGGRVILGSGEHEVICTTLSHASGEVTRGARNGWRDWWLRLPGTESWILADDWRAQQ